MNAIDLILDVRELRHNFCDTYTLCSKCPMFSGEKNEFGVQCNLLKAEYSIRESVEGALKWM